MKAKWFFSRHMDDGYGIYRRYLGGETKDDKLFATAIGFDEAEEIVEKLNFWEDLQED